MSSNNEDDKKTVILDLNALKKQKATEEEQLANIGSELEFVADVENEVTKIVSPKDKFRVILFDYQSEFFQLSKTQFPKGYDYQISKDLNDLTRHLKNKVFQIVVFNYDAQPKAVNQLSAQIKQKFPHTKVVIMAKAISPEKAKIHAATPSGATGYYQLPLDAKKLQDEFDRIHEQVKKVG